MLKNKGIAFKLIVFFTAASAIIFLLAFSYNYFSSLKIIKKDLRKNAESFTGAAVNKIDSVLMSVQKVPENFKLLIETNALNKDELVGLLRAVVENNPEIYGAAVAFEPYAFDKNSVYFAPYFYRKDGRMKLDYLGGEGYRYFYMDWYQIPKELGHAEWSEPYFDEGAGNIIMATYSVPFYKTAGGKRKFMGVVTVDISLEWLKEIVSSMKVLKTGYAALLSKNGTFITHPSNDLIMNDTVFSIAEARGDGNMRELGRKMIKGETGIYEYTNIYGQPCYLYYTPIRSNGWSLSVLFPVNELMEDITVLNRKIFIVGAAGIFLLAVAAAFISRSITEPLRAVAKAAGDIGTGNLDIELPPVRSGDEVGRLTEAFHYMRDSLEKYIEDLKETTAAKERIESELKIAHDIQMNILPKIFPPFPDKPDAFDLYAVMKPAKEVGGDFYDFFYIDASCFCFVVGDVSGKGVPAALFMAVTKTLIKATATDDADPGRVLTKVNKDLSEGNDDCMFVTLFLGMLNTKTGEVLYANGGHNPPVVMKAGGAAEFLNVPRDIIVGTVEDYEYKTHSVALNPEDSIFIYTDGVTEAMNERQELFSEKRLQEKLNSLAGKTTKEAIFDVMEETVSFAGKAPQSDDITMMMVQYRESK